VWLRQFLVERPRLRSFRQTILNFTLLCVLRQIRAENAEIVVPAGIPLFALLCTRSIEMNNDRIVQSINTLKGYVADLKKMLFKPKGRSFLGLSRSIQRYMELIENRAKICSCLGEKNPDIDYHLNIITREINDIRKMVFDYSSHTTEFMETEADIDICFDLIDMAISNLRFMHEISNSEV
jgi:hypothetical protein